MNGEIGGSTFQDWCMELLPVGSKGVLAGLQGVKNAGSAYLPPLVKFIALCRESTGGLIETGDSYSEQQHGALKPTPNGVPLCWTIGTYDDEALRKSPCVEDHAMADKMMGNGWSHPDSQYGDMT